VLGASSLLAGISGVVLVSFTGFAGIGPGDSDRLILAVGAALLGGVSVYGRRGGIAGTALAVTMLVVINQGLLLNSAPRWVTFWLPATVAILIGVVVGRLLEALAGPEPDDV
jgi:ribose/xylose/arabinose/galactoside ABC-type transport system permease subunit